MTPEELTQAIFKALVMFQKHQMEHFDEMMDTALATAPKMVETIGKAFESSYPLGLFNDEVDDIPF
jgi:hypothetical protein